MKGPSVHAGAGRIVAAAVFLAVFAILPEDGRTGNVVGMVVAPPSSPDELVLARVERERDAAMARCRRDRDSRAPDEAMARLDR